MFPHCKKVNTAALLWSEMFPGCRGLIYQTFKNEEGLKPCGQLDEILEPNLLWSHQGLALFLLWQDWVSLQKKAEERCSWLSSHVITEALETKIYQLTLRQNVHHFLYTSVTHRTITPTSPNFCEYFYSLVKTNKHETANHIQLIWKKTKTTEFN